MVKLHIEYTAGSEDTSWQLSDVTFTSHSINYTFSQVRSSQINIVLFSSCIRFSLCGATYLRGKPTVFNSADSILLASIISKAHLIDPVHFSQEWGRRLLRYNTLMHEYVVLTPICLETWAPKRRHYLVACSFGVTEWGAAEIIPCYCASEYHAIFKWRQPSQVGGRQLIHISNSFLSTILLQWAKNLARAQSKAS